jgi:hypothetical protein
MVGGERRAETAGREYQTLFFVVTPRNAAACDTLGQKVQTRLVDTDKDDRTGKRHGSINMGSCLPIPILICTLNRRYFLFSSI